MGMDVVKQKRDFMLIGLLMTLLSLCFLIYMGSSLYCSSKHWLENSIEYVDQVLSDEEIAI